jgi:hypothetical protein
MDRFNLKNLNDVESKQQFRVEVSNRFAALEDLDTEVGINSAWETIRENIKISAIESLGYFELKKHKSWFDEGCSKLLNQRKQAKLQLLQDPSEIYGDNLNNVRREASRRFRNKKREYLKDKIIELATNSKNIRDLYRGINGFQSGYQPRNNLVEDESGDLLADSHNILNMWKNYFSQLLNVHNVSHVRHKKVHTAEPLLVLGPSPLEVEIAIAKFKKYKTPGSDQIPTELIQAGGETLLSVINKLINSIWSKEQLPDQRRESLQVNISLRVLLSKMVYNKERLYTITFKLCFRIWH